MKTIAFFNNKGGVGKTSLVYHLGWILAERGVSTLAVDLDPQCNLTAMFLDEARLELIWDESARRTVFGALEPLIARTGDLGPAAAEPIRPGLALVPGDLALSRFEDLLSENWPKCLDGDAAAFRVLTAFHRLIADCVRDTEAELALIDVGPNLGAINRSALIAAQQVVLPLAPDLFSLQGLRNLGPTLREWRKGWTKRLDELPPAVKLEVPEGKMVPAGYVVMQHAVRESRPVKAYQKWMDRIPAVYRDAVLKETPDPHPPVEDDPYCLAQLKHYRSLMPMAMEARKPMFGLKASDGAIGAHAAAVAACYDDFLELAQKIGAGAGISVR